MPTINQLQTELQAIAAFNPQGNLAVQTGTAVSCVPIVAISAAYNLTRKPSTSALSLGASSFSSGVLTPDVAGLYQITVTNAGVAAAIQILALPAGAFAASAPFGWQQTNNQPRYQAGASSFALLMSMPGFSPTTCAASVELGSPGPTFGLDARILGGTLTGNANNDTLPWKALLNQ